MPEWLNAYGQMILVLAQIAYWFFMVVFVGYAVVQYKRWVNFQLGTGHSGQLRTKQPETATDVSVDEFVE